MPHPPTQDVQRQAKRLAWDDYSGYKALYPKGVTEAGCLAHARRKFFDLWANHKSAIAEHALALFARLYEIEAALKDLDPEERRRCRQQDSKPAAQALPASTSTNRMPTSSMPSRNYLRIRQDASKDYPLSLATTQPR